MRRDRPKQRPEYFTLDQFAPLARGLVFLGAGRHPKSTYYHDSSLFGNHGTLIGFTGSGNLPSDRWVRASGLGRAGLGYLTSGDYVQLPSKYITTTAWSFSTWANLVNLTDYRGLIGDVYSVPGATRIQFTQTTGVIWVADDANGRSTFGAATVGLHHYAVTWTGATLTAYIDGIVSGSPASVSGKTWKFNVLGNNGSTLFTATSTLADSCLWSRALSLPEIQQLADPANTMLSGLLRTRRKWWPVGATGTVLSVPNRSIGLDLPVDNGDSVDTMVAIGGTAPYSWQIVSQTLA